MSRFYAELTSRSNRDTDARGTGPGAEPPGGVEPSTPALRMSWVLRPGVPPGTGRACRAPAGGERRPPEGNPGPNPGAGLPEGEPRFRFSLWTQDGAPSHLARRPFPLAETLDNG